MLISLTGFIGVRVTSKCEVIITTILPKKYWNPKKAQKLSRIVEELEMLDAQKNESTMHLTVMRKITRHNFEDNSVQIINSNEDDNIYISEW